MSTRLSVKWAKSSSLGCKSIISRRPWLSKARLMRLCVLRTALQDGSGNRETLSMVMQSLGRFRAWTPAQRISFGKKIRLWSLLWCQVSMKFHSVSTLGRSRLFKFLSMVRPFCLLWILQAMWSITVQESSKVEQLQAGLEMVVALESSISTAETWLVLHSWIL